MFRDKAQAFRQIAQPPEFLPDVGVVQPALAPQVDPGDAGAVGVRRAELPLVCGLRFRAARDFGLGVVDRLPLVKSAMIRQAAAVSGGPKLLNGQPL